MDLRRSIFQKCMPCLKAPVEEDTGPEEYIKRNFGDQYTEYEYVIENLALTAVPKAILDEIPPEKPKKKFKKVSINLSGVKKEKNRVKQKNCNVSPRKSEENVEKTEDLLAEEAHSSNTPEDRTRRSKIFGPVCSQDIRYTPCYLHLCADKNACRECKLGPDNKKEILRRMLLPPGQRSQQRTPFKMQVKRHSVQ